MAPQTQEQHKALLYKHPDAFHAVVACRLFDEGTDWVPCNRLHNTDAGEASLTLAVQRFFRPLRKHPEKKDVVIRNYIPRFSPDLEMGEQRAILSNRFNAVLACIVTQGELMPTAIPVRSEGSTRTTKRISLQEAYGDKFHSVMEELLRGYEAVEDKTDAGAIKDIVEKVIADYGQPDDVEPEGLRHAMLVQIGRIACPETRESNRRTLEPDAIDAETIRLQGFDKVWEKLSPVADALCWGTDNITSRTIRELLAVVEKTPTLDEIKEAIAAYYKRTGRRPACHRGRWFDELNTSCKAVDHICRRDYGFTLAEVVAQVLGDRNDGLLEKAHELIHEYWSRGIRLTRSFGAIPEISMTASALNTRLQRNCRTTLAEEIDKLLGPATDPFTMEKVRLVIRNYLKKKARIHRAYGFIPELATTSRKLDERLRQSFKVTLEELVEDVQGKMIFNPYPPNLSLDQIHQGIRDFYQATGKRPHLQMNGHICGKKIRTVDSLCRKYHSTTFPKEVRQVLGNPHEGWLDKVRAVIGEYWSRGLRITSKSGYIPELGMKTGAINYRLSQHHKSNLAKEFEKVISS